MPFVQNVLPKNNKGTSVTLGPWVGVRDVEDSSAADPRFLEVAINAYPISPAKGGGWGLRPAFRRLGAQLASGRVQWIGQFTMLNGTQHTLAICNGQFFKYDWGGGSWSEWLDSSDFSGASITLSTTADFHAVTLANEIVFSDGVNTPWMWDGTGQTSATLTSLTAAPVFYGPMTVYYAKLFGIKNTERSTIVWSEENDPTIGYEAGGFNNAWTLGQTDQNQLVAVRGTNEALYYWRAYSCGAIYGAVDSEFQTSGTHESISSTVGTTSPRGPVIAGRSLWFMDGVGRVQRIQIGGGLVSPAPWQDMTGNDTNGVTNGMTFADTMGVQVPDLDLVLLANSVNASPATAAFVFHSDLSTYGGYWLMGGIDEFSSCGVVIESGTGVPALVFGDDDGYVYARSTVYPDTNSANATTHYDMTLRPMVLHAPSGKEVLWSEVGVVGRYVDASSNGPSTTLSTRTPYGDAVSSAFPLGGSLQGDRVRHVGVNGHGRHVQFTITANTQLNTGATISGQPFLNSMIVRGTRTSEYPGMR